MRFVFVSLVAASVLAGCAQTSVQPLTATVFKVATQAAHACGPQGAREVAFMSAAIEVIRRGEDRFVIMADQSGSMANGGQYLGYGVYQTYNLNLQDMVVQVVQPGQPSYEDSLSARQVLGADWQTIVSAGAPQTCT
jgi:hypothetical protein